jgi:hypothetical protein
MLGILGKWGILDFKNVVGDVSEMRMLGILEHGH